MKTLLLTLDFINDIAHLEGKIAHSAKRIAEHHTIANANKAIAYARKNNLLIGHVRVGFSKNYLECPDSSPIFSGAKTYKALQLNTWGTEFHGDLDFSHEDIVIVKHRISAFYKTDLETYLRAQKVEHLVICGVATNFAVEHTSRDAHDRDYKVTVLADACQTITQEAHDATLASLSRFSMIKTVDDYING